MTSLPKQRGECLCSRGRRLLLKYPSPHTANKELCNSRATRPLSVLLFLVLCSLQSLPSPSSHHALPLTSHLPLLLFLSFSPFPAGRYPGKGPSAGINQRRPSGFPGAKKIETSGGLFPLCPAPLVTPPFILLMPRSLRLCSRGPGRMFLGGGRDTASHRHCTWSSKGTTTLVNFGFFWTNSILFTYLQEEGKQKINTATAPTL